MVVDEIRDDLQCVGIPADDGTGVEMITGVHTGHTRGRAWQATLKSAQVDDDVRRAATGRRGAG